MDAGTVLSGGFSHPCGVWWSRHGIVGDVGDVGDVGENGWDDLGDPEAFDFDLAIIGAGSGNSLIVPEMDGWRIAIVERDLFGGTCLNRGCIPSKMLIHSAEVAEVVRDASRFGVHASVDAVDWPAIVARVFGRIDPIAEGGRRYRHSLDNVTVFEGEARFAGERTISVGERTFRARQIVIAAGARPQIPAVPGLDPRCGPVVPFHTSDTVMRLPALPERMVIVGGGFIAAEMAHLFSGLGCAVTMLARGPVVMRDADDELARRLTDALGRRFEVHCSTRLDEVVADGDELVVRYTSDAGGGEPAETRGDVVLVAAGRVPNGDQLGAEHAGIGLDGTAVRVDAYGRTTAPGVWALGDVNGRHQLKHMANGEARVVAHNLVNPTELRPLDDRPAPYGVFTEPQLGCVGLTERAARERHGDDVRVITHEYAAAAYGWALEDRVGIVKLVGLRSTGRLIGAHVLGYHAVTLVQQLIQGMHLGNSVEELATGQIWIHPGLPEVIEQALLSLRDALAA